MGRSQSLDMGLNFNKKRWRRRILFRFLGIVAIILLTLVAIATWVVRALPGIAVGEISRLTNAQIDLGAFDFHRDASVSINGFIVRPERDEPFYDNTILRAKNIHARFSLGSLLRLSPRVTEIRVEEFILDAQCDLDTGRWNLGGLRLNTARGGSGSRPTILLEQGRLRYCRVSGGELDVAMSVPVEARFEPTEIPDRGYRFEVRTSKQSGGYGISELHGTWSPGRFEVAGGLSSTDIPSLERAWAVDVLAADLKYDPAGNYELGVSIRNLHAKHSPEVDTFRTMALSDLQSSGSLASVQRFFARYRPFGTVGQIRLEAGGRFDALKASEISGQVVCTDVSVRDRKFPYALDHLAGEVHFTESMVTIDKLTGRHGDVEVQIEGWRKGFGDERQYQYQITSDRMILDEDLYTALRPEQKRLWDSFQPSGHIAVDYRLTRSTLFDKYMSLAVDLNDVTATYREFPYPLTGLTGRLRFDQDSITASAVRASHEGGQIVLDGKVTSRKEAPPTYYIVIDGNDIPLDDTLRKALPERHRQLYGQLGLEGVADVEARVFTSTDANSPRPIQFLADVALEQTSMHLKTLPLPVLDIEAEASVASDSVNIKRSTGRYGSGQVTMTGGVRLAHGDQRQQYHFNIATEHMPVDEAMMDVLPESVRPTVAAFHLEGPVNLAVDVKRVDSNEPAVYAATVECLGNKINHQRFPYPLRDVRGQVKIDSTGVTVTGLEARPGQQPDWESDSVIRVDGHLDLAEGHPGEATFALQAQDLLFTETLGQALPDALKGVYRDLAPRGPFDVNVPRLGITQDAAGHSCFDFDGYMDLKTCSLQVSGAGTEVVGGIDFAGAYDAEQGLSMGRLHLGAERLTVRGRDITDLNADIAYDPNTGQWSAHHFLGDCYDGRVLGDFVVNPAGSGVFQYLVAASLIRVDLQPFLLAGRAGEVTGKDYSSGILNAAVSLGSRVGDGSSRLGVCRVDVADMQVGKVSPLANLLAVLRLTEPSDYAFDRMLIESYLRRNKLLISRFDLSGKNVAFTGGGTMDLPDGAVDLTLTARGKRLAAAQPSILQSLTEGLGGAVVRMEVTGEAGNPIVETKALPVIEDSLDVLGVPR